jgi:hypothetical protein
MESDTTELNGNGACPRVRARDALQGKDKQALLLPLPPRALARGRGRQSNMQHILPRSTR